MPCLLKNTRLAGFGLILLILAGCQMGATYRRDGFTLKEMEGRSIAVLPTVAGDLDAYLPGADGSSRVRQNMQPQALVDENTTRNILRGAGVLGEYLSAGNHLSKQAPPEELAMNMAPFLEKVHAATACTHAVCFVLTKRPCPSDEDHVDWQGRLLVFDLATHDLLCETQAAGSYQIKRHTWAERVAHDPLAAMNWSTDPLFNLHEFDRTLNVALRGMK